MGQAHASLPLLLLRLCPKLIETFQFCLELLIGRELAKTLWFLSHRIAAILSASLPKGVLGRLIVVIGVGIDALGDLGGRLHYHAVPPPGESAQ